jgi:hypothetical protein
MADRSRFYSQLLYVIKPQILVSPAKLCQAMHLPATLYHNRGPRCAENYFGSHRLGKSLHADHHDSLHGKWPLRIRCLN